MNAPTAPDGAAPSEQAPLLNIANVLTVLRLLLVPVFIWLALLPGDRARLAAVVVFVVAAFTDRLDGQLARSWGLVTSFGKIADPIADKALTLSAFVLLSVNQRLWWWVTILIVVRELGITVMRFFMLRRAVMAAARRQDQDGAADGGAGRAAHAMVHAHAARGAGRVPDQGGLRHCGCGAHRHGGDRPGLRPRGDAAEPSERAGRPVTARGPW